VRSCYEVGRLHGERVAVDTNLRQVTG